jgi:hypothetical protein
MNSPSLFAIVLAASVLLSVQANLKAEGTTKFDGNWSVTLDAKMYKNPDGSVAQAVVWHFSATVRNGVFHGESGTRGKPSWYELNGRIEPDGTATLRADEITGAQKYNFSKTIKAPPGKGVSYSYQVISHFGDRRGTGQSNDRRIKIFTFTKD